jgi:hypothetical protein
VAVGAKAGSRFLQVKSEFRAPGVTHLMGYMAGVTPHVKSSMPASFFRNTHALRVTLQAEIAAFIPRRNFLEKIWNGRRVWVVALQTITSNGWVNMYVPTAWVLVFVAGTAKSG